MRRRNSGRSHWRSSAARWQPAGGRQGLAGRRPARARLAEDDRSFESLRLIRPHRPEHALPLGATAIHADGGHSCNAVTWRALLGARYLARALASNSALTVWFRPGFDFDMS